ncbi:hypothetical protein [Cellulosimicrobium marinum]|uniref:hypothetical protein n=1 Tax=Cellulosimicrobium marinum TaxID=1638992 RepID=UPI001E5593CA|nr:hypothetical protein [Cellulosimicrobium marinum]MCB7136816.1 hypothetical protein [Cellulosimicrobium marinum]
MNAPTRTDEDFARTLRDRLDAAAPDVDVDTSAVVPAARRVRRRHRTGVALVAALGLVGSGATWAAQPWADLTTTDLQPATVLPYVPGDDVPTIDGGWPDAPYWHVRSESSGSSTDGSEESETRDTWYGNGRPGLFTVEDSPDDVTSFGPRAWADLLVDGERVLVGWDGLYALPTDPDELEQLLRDSVEADRGAGTADDKVFDMARSLLVGSPAPPALRDALWEVMSGLPTSTPLGEVTDSRGRTGEGVETSVQGWTTRLVYDPDDHRVLEESGAVDEGVIEDLEADGGLDGVIMSTTSRTTYLDEGPADAPPSEPRLEDSGCVDWATC